MSTKWLKDNIGKTITVLVTVFAVFGGVWAFENRVDTKLDKAFEVNDKLYAASMQEVLKQQKSLNHRQAIEEKQRQVHVIKSQLSTYVQFQRNLQAQISYYESLQQTASVRNHLVKLRDAKMRCDARVMALQMELERIQ